MRHKFHYRTRIIYPTRIKWKGFGKKSVPRFIDLFRLTLYRFFLSIECFDIFWILENDWGKIHLGINPHRDHSSESTALVCAGHRSVNYKRDYAPKLRLIIKVLELRWKSMERVVGWKNCPTLIDLFNLYISSFRDKIHAFTDLLYAFDFINLFNDFLNLISRKLFSFYIYVGKESVIFFKLY